MERLHAQQEDGTMSDEALRQEVSDALRLSLAGAPSNTKDSKLWEWLKDAPMEKMKSFFCGLVDKLHDIHLYFVEHSSAVSYCMGSHSNAVSLGSLEQAKGAMFYITPYLENCLEQCLMVLEKASQHFYFYFYPSKAGNTGTER
jgi:hypothetical protein